jgi:hypothetical protein
MSTTTEYNGRLCNQIIRNLCVSAIAKANNLYVIYSSYDRITKLGIKLFCGNKIYNESIKVNDINFFTILNNKCILNINADKDYFQTTEIINYLYNYLNEYENKTNIINANPFKERYNNNNDCFIHIRLTDAINHNPGLQYYLKTIEKLFSISSISSISSTSTSDKLFIASDDNNNIIIKKIIEKYPNAIIVNYNEVETIQFGSTCKHIILSHGSYSAMIGYLAFYSNIYFKQIDINNKWHGDLFSIPTWNCIC